jgi:hypothetical protein
MGVMTVTVGSRLDLACVRKGHGFGSHRKDIGPHGTVEFIGSCGHPPCKHGDRCVVVRWDGAATTMNYSVADVEAAVLS